MTTKMQSFKLEELPLNDLIEKLKIAFSRPPIITRSCVKVLNQILYNFTQLRQGHSTKNIVNETVLKNILIIVLKGMDDTQDVYLKNYLYLFLIELNRCSEEFGIMSINTFVKEIDSKMCYKHPQLKNLAMRALFLNLPTNMLYDFEKYLKQALMNEKLADNSVVLCSEYFKKMNINRNAFYDISDYHSSFFCKIALNKYSCLIEIKKALKNKEYAIIFECLNRSSDEIVQLEACKALVTIEPEQAAPHVEKSVQILRGFLKSSTDVRIYAGLKVLSLLSQLFYKQVSRANREIEDLVHSSNQSIAMLAILTLLKTGTEESVKKLALKLEPYLSSMSNQYKIMAIDTMDKLSKNNYEEYLLFLRKCLLERNGTNDILFKKYLIKKFNIVLRRIKHNEKCRDLYLKVVRFLVSYLEDPEFYQLTMEILGILGEHLNSQPDLIHIYNRLILDNQHVRNCALQTLFDLNDKFDTMETIKNLNQNTTESEIRFRNFLADNVDIQKSGDFELSELGDLKESVLNILGDDVILERNAENETVEDCVYNKKCRPIYLTEEKDDFTIKLIKHVEVMEESHKVNFEFDVKLNLEKVVLKNAIIKFTSSSGKNFEIEVNGEGNFVYEDVDCEESDVFNGVFDYQLALEDDVDDVESDSIQLNAFEITVLDYAMPKVINEDVYHKCDEFEEKIEIKLKCSPEETVSQLMQKSNLYLLTDQKKFTMSGSYQNEMILILGEISFNNVYSTVNITFKCTDEKLLKNIVSIFK